MLKFSRDFVVRGFKRFGYDILLLGEWYSYLLNNGVEKPDLFDVTAEFIDRRLVAPTLEPYVLISDFEKRIKNNPLLADLKRKFESLEEGECLNVDGVIIDTVFDASSLRDDMVIVSFWDSSRVTFGEYKGLIQGAFDYFRRDELAELEFMGYLMHVHGFNLERANILTRFLDLVPNIESIFIKFEFVRDSLEALGLLRIAKIVSICLELGDDLLGFTRIGK